MINFIVSAQTNICFGPLCNQISGIVPNSSGNSQAMGIFGSVLGKIINLIITVAGITFFGYLLYGAFQWIVSSGDKEKLTKAQLTITHAIVGLVVVFAALTIFGLFAGDILGIIKIQNGSWVFSFPSLFSN